MKATAKQISYIQQLISQKHGIQATRAIPAGVRHRYNLSAREARWDMTKAEASELIDQLQGA